jgi:hypothetical protein
VLDNVDDIVVAKPGSSQRFSKSSRQFEERVINEAPKIDESLLANKTRNIIEERTNTIINVTKKAGGRSSLKNSSFSRKDMVVSDEEEDYGEANGWGNKRGNQAANEEDESSEGYRKGARAKWSKDEQNSRNRASAFQNNYDAGDDDYRSDSRKNALTATNIVRNINTINEDITLNVKRGSKGQGGNNYGGNSRNGNDFSDETNITNINSTNISRSNQNLANDFFDEDGDDDNGRGNGGRNGRGGNPDNNSNGNSSKVNRANPNSSSGRNGTEAKRSGLPSNNNANGSKSSNPNDGPSSGRNGGPNGNGLDGSQNTANFNELNITNVSRSNFTLDGGNYGDQNGAGNRNGPNGNNKKANKGFDPSQALEDDDDEFGNPSSTKNTRGPLDQGKDPKRSSNPFRDYSNEPKGSDGSKDPRDSGDNNPANKPGSGSNNPRGGPQGNQVSKITNVVNRTINITDDQDEDFDDDYEEDPEQPKGTRVKKANPGQPNKNVPKKSTMADPTPVKSPLPSSPDVPAPQKVNTPNTASNLPTGPAQPDQTRVVPQAGPTVRYSPVNPQNAPGTYRPATYAPPTTRTYSPGINPQPTFGSRTVPVQSPDSFQPMVTQVKTYIDGVLQYSGPERPNGDYGTVRYPTMAGTTYQNPQSSYYPGKTYQTSPPSTPQLKQAQVSSLVEPRRSSSPVRSAYQGQVHYAPSNPVTSGPVLYQGQVSQSLMKPSVYTQSPFAQYPVSQPNYQTTVNSSLNTVQLRPGQTYPCSGQHQTTLQLNVATRGCPQRERNYCSECGLHYINGQHPNTGSVVTKTATTPESIVGGALLSPITNNGKHSQISIAPHQCSQSQVLSSPKGPGFSMKPMIIPPPPGPHNQLNCLKSFMYDFKGTSVETDSKPVQIQPIVEPEASKQETLQPLFKGLRLLAGKEEQPTPLQEGTF